MFRALYAHYQEVELYWCSIWSNKWLDSIKRHGATEKNS